MQEGPRFGDQRIYSLDLIRGVAICGLAPINILDFASPEDLYLIPPDEKGFGIWIWAVVNQFAAGKFISLFSLLFGAGIILQTREIDSKLGSTASMYLPRLGWLWVLGMLHAYLIWYGDILVPYALTGFVIFWCRKWSARSQAIVGLLVHFLFIITISGLIVAVALMVPDLEGWSSEEEDLGVLDPANMGKGWIEQMPMRASVVLLIHLIGIPVFFLPFTGSLMLLGMALLKSGFFEGTWSRISYLYCLIPSLAIGLIVGAVGLFFNWRSEWDPNTILFHTIWTVLVTPCLVFAYAILLVGWSGKSTLGWLQAGFRAIGKMALSNYIGQSLIFSLIFYGHGFDYYGKLSFSQIIMIPLAVWVVQMIFSVFWLERFQFGPLEWVWRCLSYRKRLPLRKIAIKY